jgi:arsenate reductase
MIDEPIAAGANELRAALTAENLPVDDLEGEQRLFFRFSENGSTVGFGGFELHGDNVLLRSIVILPQARSRGLGRATTERLLRRAFDAGARNAYLLTTSAAPFFERNGFRPIDRRDAPADILATRQAASLCPSSATLMVRSITREPKVSRVYNVLFLCTGNSARSILAESILQKDGAGRFRAFSAGSQPKGAVNPFALKVLRAMGYPAEGFRSKAWDEFATPGAPVMDFVFTVCDSAAGETCPVWPGQPMTAHWGIEDPAAVEGTNIEKERAFSQAARFLKNRISVFLSLPLATIDHLALGTRLRDIGRMEGSTVNRKQAG